MADEEPAGEIQLALATEHQTTIRGEPRTVEAVVIIRGDVDTSKYEGKENTSVVRETKGNDDMELDHQIGDNDGDNDDGNQGTARKNPKRLTITEHEGDIFHEAPDNTVLVHACNCQGYWGRGIASDFAGRYPQANLSHQQHCYSLKDKKGLLGTAQLIPPMDGTPRHYVACLYTSVRTGTRKSPPEVVLQATGTAMIDLLRQINQEKQISGIRVCRINSGLFTVPWDDTFAVLQALECEDDWQHTAIELWSLPTEKGK
ncbi:hypothetical protein P152DRAFT_3788 [Eremomyces bilateralis CBS 781.70]|uniref:ADP-ribose 1''-phosphate phosphatase n=1 Tax=Eremomyces bilateralis CBS 781.70 TaxID=1392243 RepID=A0A6G1GFQ6_9PEZI|nr:uncharacterized protein P152DRAFT_3788 [Eremomyces bilateralis CBS 781.70]KAF1816908.1 hypothetical protein P152DRAFT_3788 [Eremomyces bilateralis CBS 781.70]